MQHSDPGDYHVQPSFTFGADPSAEKHADDAFVPPAFASPNVYRYEPFLATKMLHAFPVLVGFGVMLMSARLSCLPEVDAKSRVPSVVFASLIMAAVLPLVICFCRKVGFYETKSHASHARFNTVFVILGAAFVYTASHLLSINRLATVLLGLHLNQFNHYTIMAFFFDCYFNSQNIVSVLAGYFLVLAGYSMLSSANYVAFDPRISGLFLSLGALGLFFYRDSLRGDVFVPNVLAAFILAINVTPHLHTSYFVPLFMSIITTSGEYFVPPQNFTSSRILDLVLAFTIKCDREVSSSTPGTSMLRELLNHSDTKAILGFLLLNTSFMFIQLVYSFRSGSLGLFSDSLHMALDCLSLALGLVAGVLSKTPVDKNSKFPFGLGRFETLAGFANGTLLIGISGGIVFEAVSRLYNPVVLHETTELFVVSCLGLLVNLVGIFAFNHGHHHGHSHSHEHSHQEDHHPKSHGGAHTHSHTHADKGEMNSNMRGIFLHILADTLGSVGVVISLVLTKYFGWEGFDPVASIIIAVVIFFSAVPLVKSTGEELLLSNNKRDEEQVRAVLTEVGHVKGVKSLTTPKFWPAQDALTGYIHIQVYRGENITYIRQECEKLFHAAGIDVTLQLEFDYDSCWCR